MLSSLLAPLTTPIAAGLLIAALAGNAWQWLGARQQAADTAQARADTETARRALADERAARATEREQLTAAALAATERARQTEAHWRDQHATTAAAAQAQLERARRDADTARAAGDSLRARAAHYASLCNPAPADPGAATADHPTPAANSSPTRHAGLVLADVLGRMDAAGRLVAQIADARGAAGTACQQAYDALTAAPPRAAPRPAGATEVTNTTSTAGPATGPPPD